MWARRAHLASTGTPVSGRGFRRSMCQMTPSLKPAARLVGRLFSRLAACSGWAFALLFVSLSGAPACLRAQTAPAPAPPDAPAGAAPQIEKTASPATPGNAKPPPSPAELQRAAIAQQRDAVRKQAESLGLWLMPLQEGPARPPAPVVDCDPLEDSIVNPLIENAAKAQGLETKLLRAVIDQESGYRACAVSAKGAQGLMQLMPETAAEMGVKDPFDAKQNVDGGARYLKQLIDRYKGDLPQALGAYNAGPKTVDQSAGVPDVQETREYVEAVMAKAGLKPADPAAKASDAAAPGDVAKEVDKAAKPVDAAAKPATPPAPPAPAKPADTPPAKPADVPPAKPADTPPAKPADTPPAKPADTPPAKPADVPPAKPADVPPAKPAVAPPAKPADAPPKNGSPAPNAPDAPTKPGGNP